MRKALPFIVPTVCILVVGVTFFLLFRLQNQVEELNYGTGNINVEENTVVPEENTVENEINESNYTNTQNEVIENTNVVEEDNVVPEEEDNLSKNNLEKAISLVQKYWGEDKTVYLTNEGMTSDGDYIVAVRQKTSTVVKDYFKVNIETKNVEIYY